MFYYKNKHRYQNKMCNGNGECLTQTDIRNEYEYLFECPHNCQPIKCPNFKLCKSKYPQWVGNCHQNRCLNCDILWGNKNLEFILTTEDCSVCLEYKSEHIKFPSCEHSVCILCFEKLNNYDWDESKYHINPVLYGCPSCPNGCLNPDIGTQCYCEEYDYIKE